MEKLKPHPFNMFFFVIVVYRIVQQEQQTQMIVRVLRYAWPNMSKVVPFTLKN